MTIFSLIADHVVAALVVVFISAVIATILIAHRAHRRLVERITALADRVTQLENAEAQRYMTELRRQERRIKRPKSPDQPPKIEVIKR